jgi:hypothetical protein
LCLSTIDKDENGGIVPQIFTLTLDRREWSVLALAEFSLRTESQEHIGYKTVSPDPEEVPTRQEIENRLSSQYLVMRPHVRI